MGDHHEEDAPKREPALWDRVRRAAVDISTIGSFAATVGAVAYAAVADTSWETIVTQLASALRAVFRL